MSANHFVWWQLQFPRDVTAEAITAALLGLHGLSAPGRQAVFALQVVAEAGRIHHYLGAPPERRHAVVAQLAAHLPGLTLTDQSAPLISDVRLGARLWLSSSRRPLRQDDPAWVSRALLGALDGLRPGERVSLQWLLGPVRRPLAVPNTPARQLPESWALALASAPVLGPKDVDSEARRALRLKQGEPGWRASGSIAIAAHDRQAAKALLGRLLGALRTAEGPGVSLGMRPLPLGRLRRNRLPWRWPLALSVSELAGLSSWPVGDVGQIPVLQRRARILPVPRLLPSSGRMVAVDVTGSRRLALSAADSLQHTLLLGPTGTGKSTVIINLAVQDMAAGRSVVLVDPKGDLVDDLLRRIPANRINDVVVIDPADPAPVGLNPLRAGDPDLVADQVLSIIAKLNSDSWGPRLSELLHAALLSLAATPGMNLAALPLLLSHDGFRRRIVGALDDPLGVSPVWAWYDHLSDEARQQARATVLNKVRPLVGRPMLRAILGQAEPRFRLSDLFYQRRILLVRLDKGRLGPEAARLLGTLVVNQLWQTTLRRSKVSPERRHPVMVYLDELQDFVALPADLSEVLSQSRGLGVAWHLATQFLDQLPSKLQAAALSQARSRVLFQLSYADAAVLARGHRELEPEDLTELPAREVYLRLVHGSAVTQYFSGRTLPPPAETSDPVQIMAASRGRYGVPREDTDAALRALVEPPAPAGGAIGVRRRQP